MFNSHCDRCRHVISFSSRSSASLAEYLCFEEHFASSYSSSAIKSIFCFVFLFFRCLSVCLPVCVSACVCAFTLCGVFAFCSTIIILCSFDGNCNICIRFCCIPIQMGSELVRAWRCILLFNNRDWISHFSRVPHHHHHHHRRQDTIVFLIVVPHVACD